jgi:hypothetical protein
MAVLNNGASEYPTSLDSKIDEKDEPRIGNTRVRANVVNGTLAAIVNIETELGLNVSGDASDLKTRLSNGLSGYGLPGGILIVGSGYKYTTLADALSDIAES